MERMTHMRCNGIKSGYWSPEKKENLVQRLAEYENTGLEPEEIAEVVHKWVHVAEGLPLGDERVLVQVNGTYKNVTYENAILTGALKMRDGSSMKSRNGKIRKWLPGCRFQSRINQ